MKTFLKKSVVFVFIMAMYLVAIELVLLTKPNVYSYKREYIENHLDDISVLYMGNSHIEEAIIPELICDSSFNFAISGRSFSVDVELAERYIPQMNNLRIVVMPLDYTRVNFGRLEHRDVVDSKKRERINRTYKCMYTKYFGVHQYGLVYWSEILNSDENYMGRLLENKKSRDFCDSLGYVSLKVSNRPQDWYEQRVPGKLKHNVNIKKEQYNNVVNGYEKICQLSKERGARLVLVSAPVYRTYQEAIEEELLNDNMIL